MRSINSLFSSVKNRVASAQCARRDFRTNQHIVVFESDDWGSIRMSSRKDWENLLRKGYAVDKRPYERFDTLESPKDLEALLEVLTKHKDCNGNHPVITANMLMANPDFEKIGKDNYSNYYYEPISKTYERYFGNTSVLDIMKQGLNEGVFMPQSHGREHFNVTQWMKGLQDHDDDFLEAFQHGMCGIAPKNNPAKGNLLMNALYYNCEEEQLYVDSIVREGLSLFKMLWGFRSKTFVAPCYLWNGQIETVLADGGVRLLQTSRVSKSLGSMPARLFYSGQHNDLGQLYSIRNCMFEPATNEGGGSVASLMAQLDRTFASRKIAVFSTHRINYVSGIDENNRTKTLSLLHEFLTKMLKKYPDTVFLSSDKLIELLKSK